MDLYLEFERQIPEEQANIIRNAIVERGKRKPLQYIIGNVQFLDCVIEVNEDVLIPRPETEYMVDVVRTSEFGMLNKIPPNPPLKRGGFEGALQRGGFEGALQRGEYNVLDLCTGSGAIAIALKKNFNEAEVFATDICEKALAIAKLNADVNECEIVFVRSDMFECFKIPPNPPLQRGGLEGALQRGGLEGALKREGFDIIISNPPYISEEDYKTLEPEIFFEPKIALLAEKNGLYFYEKILKEAKEYLKDDGLLYLEIGSEQADDVIKLAKENNYTEYTIHKDLSDRNRFVRIKK